MSSPRKFVVGITGASGVIFGVRLLEYLRSEPEIETHLVMSSAGALTITEETTYSVAEVKKFAEVSYKPNEIGAAIASGSFRTDGMIVAPCSIKTLSGIVNSYDDNLIVRAGSVTLKERRTLVLMVRETPLHKGHLDLMQRAADFGAVIMPPMPSFYSQPMAMSEMIDQVVGRVLDQFDIVNDLAIRWNGISRS